MINKNKYTLLNLNDFGVVDAENPQKKKLTMSYDEYKNLTNMLILHMMKWDEDESEYLKSRIVNQSKKIM